MHGLRGLARRGRTALLESRACLLQPFEEFASNLGEDGSGVKVPSSSCRRAAFSKPLVPFDFNWVAAAVASRRLREEIVENLLRAEEKASAFKRSEKSLLRYVQYLKTEGEALRMAIRYCLYTRRSWLCAKLALRPLEELLDDLARRERSLLAAHAEPAEAPSLQRQPTRSEFRAVQESSDDFREALARSQETPSDSQFSMSLELKREFSRRRLWRPAGRA